MGGWSSGKYTTDLNSDVKDGEEVNQPWLLPEEEEDNSNDDDDDGDGSDGDDHAPPAAKRRRLY